MNTRFPAKPRIAVVGLGYVGLPLAVEFARHFDVIGFDINARRIEQLSQASDQTQEVEPEALSEALRAGLRFSDQADSLADCDVYIVTVPTPIDSARRPDLTPLISASQTIGQVLAPGNVVIYESTVYPGCTEEDCVPVLERLSGLKALLDGHDADPSQGFHVGYSPERINPGDKTHRLPSIRKVTSGSNPAAADFIDALYGRIITAGTFKAASIRVAEAAKVIENTQRDVNIALVNELAMLFNRLGLDTSAVLEAASTKWNFLPFKPGLVGGHCIGVDPYYLTHKAQQAGFHPQMILAGRRTNDGMGSFVAGELVKLMARRGVYQPGARVLVLGLTFKENCPDLRNTRVVDVVNALAEYQLVVDVHDPWASADEAREEYGIELVERPESGRYQAVMLCVAHEQFLVMDQAPGLRAWLADDGVLYDIKAALPVELVDGRL